MISKLTETILGDTQALGILLICALALLLLCAAASIGAWVCIARRTGEILERVEDTDIRMDRLSKSIRRRVSREYGGEQGDDA